jgi:hypothetical protein
MARAKKHGSRRPKARKASRRKGKAKRRVSFPKLWQRIGNSVLRAVGKDQRKALVLSLGGDRELQQLVVERTVRLLSARASEVAVREAVPATREEASDDYALAARAVEQCCGDSKGPDTVPAEEKADWRVF